MLAGTHEACPVPLACRDGSLIPVETVVTRGTWSGQPVLVGVSRDPTAVRRAEEEPGRSEAQKKSLPDVLPDILPDVLFRLAADGMVSDVHSGMEVRELAECLEKGGLASAWRPCPKRALRPSGSG